MALLLQLVDGVVVHKFSLDGGALSIGRLQENDVVIEDTSVSSKHAFLECKPNPDFSETLEYFITDLNSTNGTEVNGDAIKGTVRIRNDDEIKIAWNTFKFVEQLAENLSKTVHILK